MATTVLQALAQARVKLGVKPGDPEFTPESLLASLNASLGDLHQDLSMIAPALLEDSATLAADTVSSHTYTFATQTPAIGAVARAMAVRLDDRRGLKLDSVRSIVELDDFGGMRYAITGAFGAQVIETAESVDAGRPLFLRYVQGFASLAANGTVPGWVPDHYVDLLGLMIAEQSFSQGGEASFPRDQAMLLQRRKDALHDYWAFLNPSPLMRQDTSEGLAPHIMG